MISMFLVISNEILLVNRSVDLLMCKDGGIRSSYMCLRLILSRARGNTLFPYFESKEN